MRNIHCDTREDSCWTARVGAPALALAAKRYNYVDGSAGSWKEGGVAIKRRDPGVS